MRATSPLLRGTPRLSRYDAGHWVLACPDGRQLLLTAHSVSLLHLLATAPTLEAGHEAFQQQFATTLPVEQFGQLVTQAFGGYGLLQQDAIPARPHPAPPLRLRLILLTSHQAARLAAPLRNLYAPRVFWPVLAGSAALLLGLHCQLPPPTLTVIQGSWALLGLYGSAVGHELGHIAACRRAGLPTGAIGAGLYLGLPVLYADVTGLWGGTRHQRLIGNLGGIYSQLVLATGIACVGAVTGLDSWRSTAELIALAAGWQLNPFTRHDGYWVLSDLLNLPNLQARAIQVRNHVLSAPWPHKRPRTKLTKQQWGLLGYAVANATVTGVVVAYGLAYALPLTQQVISDYALLWAQLLQGALSRQSPTLLHLPVLAFYGWLGRAAWLRLRHHLAHPRATRN